jgi:hypothetical protein
MRTTLLRFLPLVALFATGCVIEVEDDDDWSGGTATPPYNPGSGGRGNAPGAGGAGGGATAGSGNEAGQGGGGEVAPAFVRFAHLAPTTEAVDICVRPVDFADSWSHPDFVFGPLFANNAVEYPSRPDADPALEANPKDFYFPGVSTFFELSPPGAWQVRVVKAGDPRVDTIGPSCKSAFEGVADLSLDLRSGEVLTVALEGPTAPATLAPAEPLQLRSYEGAAADPAAARARVIDALTAYYDGVTLGALDVATGQVAPLAPAAPSAAGTGDVFELAAGKPGRYALLGLSGDDGTRPLLTPVPLLELTPAAGDVWSFFAAGTGLDEAELLLQPQLIACRDATQGAGLNAASLIAADCTYLNSKKPEPPPVEPPVNAP